MAGIAATSTVSLTLAFGMFLKIPAGKHLMDLVAVDWFKDTKRMDHVARRQGCAAQVSIESHIFSTFDQCSENLQLAY